MNGVSSDQIRALLVDAGLLAPTANIDELESLFGMGILDSLRLIGFVAKLEGRFGIRINDDELIPDNFDSIGNLTSYVSAKMQ